jgi:carbon monoxide dehydrogenase subunit G
MEIKETFTVDAAPAAVWDFFQDLERVGRCVPGVQQIERLAPERYKIVATQNVGFISATFEMITEIQAREPLRYLELSSVGKSVQGAAGHLRSRDRVHFEATADGGTVVTITSELAVGGMLGALGHRGIASKSREITAQFAHALRAQLRSVAGSATGATDAGGAQDAPRTP